MKLRVKEMGEGMNEEQKEREAYLKAIGITKEEQSPEMNGNSDSMKTLNYARDILLECEKRKYTLQDVGELLEMLRMMAGRSTEIIRMDALFKVDVQPQRKNSGWDIKVEDFL